LPPKTDNTFVKLILLGSGDSGKTTLRKQMRSLYGAGFNESERRMMIPVIFGNIVEGTAAVLAAVPAVNEVRARLPAVERAFLTPRRASRQQTLHTAAAKSASDMITGLPSSSYSKIQMTDELAAAIKACWEDAGFQRALTQRAKFQLQCVWP